MTLGLRHRLALLLAALVLLVMTLFGHALPPGMAAPFVLVLLTVVAWATAAMPEHVTSLLFFSLALVLGLASPETVFQGFTTGAFWLVFSGIVMAASVVATGLGGRLRAWLARLSGRTYLRAVATAATGGALLAFAVPAAIPRVMILLPVTDALAAGLGFARGSKGHAGLVLATLLATIVPSFAILTGNLPNLVLLGAMQSIHGVEIGYLDYLSWNFPVLGLLKLVSIVLIAAWSFAEAPGRPFATETNELGWTPAQIRLSCLLVAAVLFWATDTLHGVQPGWVGLAAATFCLLPGIGFLDAKAFSGQVNTTPLFYIAGVLGLVSLVAASGIGTWLGGHLLALAHLGPDALLVSYAKLVAVAGGIALVVTHPNIPTVMVPAAADIAAATGLSLKGVAMAQVAAFSLLFLPYQTAPMAVGLALSGVELGRTLRFLLLNALVSLLVLTPLQGLWLWWRGVLALP